MASRRLLSSDGSKLIQARPTAKPLGPVAIDWTNPVSYGLIDCLIFNEGAGSPINLAAPSIITTLTNNPTWVMGPTGPGGYTTGGSYFGIPDHASTRWWQADCTVRIRFRPISWPGLYTAIFDKYDAGTTQRDFCVFVDTNGNISFIAVDDGGVIGSITTNMVPGADYDLIVTYTRSDLKARGYVNGTFCGFITQTGTGNNGLGVTRLGWADPGGTNPNAVYYSHQVWNRVLTTQEIAYLASNPYGFLIPSEGEMPALRGPAGAAPTLYEFMMVGCDGFA